MVSRLILGTTISLALVLCPFLVNDTHAKSSRKKSSQSAVKASRSSERSKPKIVSRSSGRHSYYGRSYSSRSYQRYRGDDDYEPSYNRSEPSYSSTPSYSSYTPRYYRAGIAETGPLMKITPQRDGRFVLEPLGPQKAVGPSKPSSSNTDRQIAPMRRSGDDYSGVKPDQNSPIYPRWNFPELVLTLAKRYEGGTYRRGADLETSSSTDCSGFVQYVCHNFMVDLPRCSSEQAQVGKTVTSQMDFSKMLPGDLLFFRRGGGGVGHVGMYMGNGKMIHASSPRSGIIVTDLTQPYYLNTFVVAKRVFEVSYPN
jgi:cell wall-associated NlpC family hydrolase